MQVAFSEYDRQTEELISYVLTRIEEDDVLSRAMRWPRLLRAITLVGSLRSDIADYRHAVKRAAASKGLRRRAWQLMSRYLAFTLRVGAGQYQGRAGFDQRWLRAPRPR